MWILDSEGDILKGNISFETLYSMTNLSVKERDIGFVRAKNTPLVAPLVCDIHLRF